MKTKITITLIALLSVVFSSFAQQVSTELNNPEHWSSNKKGTVALENGKYILTQTEGKEFKLVHNYQVDFTKPFELLMDIKIVEGSSFYIGLNAANDDIHKIKIGIITYQIYIDHWRKDRTNEVKLLKKKFPETVKPRLGIGLKIRVIDGIMLVEIADKRTGLVLNYKTKPFKINPEFKNFMISNYGSKTMTKVEISNFEFNYL